MALIINRQRMCVCVEESNAPDAETVLPLWSPSIGAHCHVTKKLHLLGLRDIYADTLSPYYTEPL